MSALVEYQDGTLLNLADLGKRGRDDKARFVVQDFIRSSASIEPYQNEARGKHGRSWHGADYRESTITVPFYFEGWDLVDYAYLRDEIYDALAIPKPYYIYEGRAHNGPSEIQWGKRYYVYLKNVITPKQHDRFGKGELQFETAELPFAESTATTLAPFYIPGGGEDKELNLWSLGNTDVFRENLNYVYRNPNYHVVYNGGSVTVDPDEGLYLEITFRGASNNLRIRNLTTGTTFGYNGSTAAGDVITIKGIEVKKNSAPIIKDTSPLGELLTFAPKNNNIQVTGASSGSVLFVDMRWYWP